MINQEKRKILALEAMKKAMLVRSKTLKLEMTAPIDVFDAAKSLGIRVIFSEFKTIEGVYRKGNPADIVITSLRPSGRQVFTCGHEIGHHVFGHGSKLGEILDWGSDLEEEFLANCFSGYLIMPPTALNHNFTVRGWTSSNPTPEQIFIVAGALGVGYTSLIDHMTFALRILRLDTAKALKRVTPKSIREKILGAPVNENVIVVDKHWQSQFKAVDVEVGDYLLLPTGTIAEGSVLEHWDTTNRYEIYRANCPGRGRIMNSVLSWSSFVRVSRVNYVGQARHRYKPDEEFDCG